MQAEKTLGTPPGNGIAAQPRPILVVDDDPNFRRILHFTLEMSGYAVLLTGSAEDALEIAARNKDIQLLITDVAMPVMNGAELAQKVREIQPDIEVLYLSGFPFQAMAARGIAIDPLHFLQKPFVGDVLDERIKAILAGVKAGGI